MGEFRMPSLGADMTEGRVVRWLVGPGDVVHRGDVVAVVDTDKAEIEVEVFEDGVVEEILVPEGGDRVPVGTTLARLGPVEGAPPAEAPAAPSPEPAPAPEPVAVPVPGKLPAPVHSPVVRRRAAELGVDLEAVRGTGPGGRVTRADVERAGAPPRTAVTPAPARSAPPPAGPERGRRRVSPRARRRAAELGVDLDAVGPSRPGAAITGLDVERAGAAQAPAPPAPIAPPAAPAPPVAEPRGEVGAGAPGDRQAAIRQRIAALMARSKREIPHYYLGTHVDLSRALAWLEQANLERPVTGRILPAALLSKAVALALREHPRLNGFWVDDELRPGSGIHLGVAIALRGGGLVAPAIHDADTLSLDELMAALRDLVARTRAGRLRGTEMTDPTITVTNLGDRGVETVYGVIYPPQVALVGFGKVVERPWAVGGMVGAHPVVHATLSADHRATDGHLGARFLATVDRLLQEPEQLMAGAARETTGGQGAGEAGVTEKTAKEA
ncbi:MAG: 2-oxo acid dehydrogenase subunit E2 [Acidimicrobiia bacterium]|nr:2-oxo acid dehydrogenase subunit E2 [Acidimicrobiia bacterium]